ncbi:aquaporin-1 isoform X1 [Micropterus salmoides]|uniref:aquaporin-1 isoform X1 n=2 Tax=Micropterus salmoides TaxID=27706 RepID=UPI0018ECA8AA|nr:aquaporin-1 isoform X1 [Micropterus salmoides]XP_038565487.1 aquaporin-1 isoform X1 [Micropterus salmoides]
MFVVAIMLVPRCLRLTVSDVWTLSCLRHFLLEFLGTALFLSASLSALLITLPAAGRPALDPRCASNRIHPNNLSDLFLDSSGLVPDSPACPLQVALVFGLSVAMAAVCVGGEAHLNPAVTIVMALSLRLRVCRAAVYVIGQLLGGVASAAVLLGLTGDVTPALNRVSPGVQLHQALAVEMLVTLQLVLVVLATVDVPLPAVAPPLLVGLAVSLGHLVAVGATGCGMNPARSLGPAVVTLDFNNHWVFWGGPGLGACLAALLNDLLLRPRWRRPREWWAELKQLYVFGDKQQQVALSHMP